MAKELKATTARVDRIHEQARTRLGHDHDHDAEQPRALMMLRFDDVAVPNDGKTTKGTRRRTTSRSRSRARSN